MYIIVGLGNTGEEYRNTRHNAGLMVADYAEGSLKVKAKFLHLETFMNKSGAALVKYVKSKTVAKKLVVIHDDLDLALGDFKISYNRGSGGHRGVESIQKALKTKEFIRLRVGISPQTPSGKLKKPKGEKAVLDFILKKFKPAEEKILKKVFKQTTEAVETIVSEGWEIASNRFN